MLTEKTLFGWSLSRLHWILLLPATRVSIGHIGLRPKSDPSTQEQWNWGLSWSGLLADPVGASKLQSNPKDDP